METAFYRKIVLVQVERAGLQGLTRILMNEYQKPVIITDAQGKVLSWHCPAQITLPMEERLILPSTVRQLKDSSGVGVLGLKGQKLDFACWPIGSDPRLGYVFVFGSKEVEPDLANAAQMISLAAMVEIAQRREIAERERIYRDEFVRDLLFNNFYGMDDVVRAGKVWGWDFTVAHIALVFESLPEQRHIGGSIVDKRPQIEQQLLEVQPGCIVGVMGSLLVILIPWQDVEGQGWHVKAQAIYSELSAQFPEILFNAGVGKLHQNVNMLYRSYQQAKVALELGRIVLGGNRLSFFDELGAVRLFYNQPEQDLEEFYKEILGPLERYDRDNNGSLAATLWHYLLANRESKVVKEKLFIHANTLRYRLKKIEELVGASLEDEETRFNLFAALKVAAILGKIQGSMDTTLPRKE